MTIPKKDLFDITDSHFRPDKLLMNETTKIFDSINSCQFVDKVLSFISIHKKKKLPERCLFYVGLISSCKWLVSFKKKYSKT